MSLYRVVPTEGTRVHLAQAMDGHLAVMLPPEDVTADNWFHWRTVCGKDVIGHRTTGFDADCARCLAALKVAKATVADIRARFGDGEVL